MSRDAGQLRRRSLLVGVVAVGVVAAGFVATLDLLINVQEPAAEAPAEPQPQPCEQLADDLGAEPWEVSSSQLIQCPRLFDGRRVRYSGEAVRAVLAREDTAWVNLNDDSYGLAIGPLPEHRTTDGGNSGIPVLIPGETTEQIDPVGDHRHLGDVLQVTGVFLRAAPFDGGGPAIRADTAVIITQGHTVTQTLSRTRIAVAGIGVVLVGILAIVGRRTSTRGWRPNLK